MKTVDRLKFLCTSLLALLSAEREQAPVAFEPPAPPPEEPKIYMAPTYAKNRKERRAEKAQERREKWRGKKQ